MSGCGPRIGLLTAERSSWAAGASVLAGVMAVTRAPVSVLAVVRTEPPGDVSLADTPARVPDGRPAVAPPRTAARRLAHSLQLRGFAATASGRIVLVRLVAGTADAPTQVARLDAACGSAPFVVAITGPRCAVLDGVLAGLDATVALLDAGTPNALARLAACDERAHVVVADVAPVTRALAWVGVPAVTALRHLGRELGDR